MKQLAKLPRWLWIRLFRKSRWERRLLAEAAACHVVAWVAVRVVPFRRWSHRLGTMHQETALADDPSFRETVGRVGWAVECTKRWLPWHVTCLMEGVAAKMMLARRGIPSTLYLGVVPARADAPMEAHAWLRCGTAILTGAEGRERFTTVTAFGSAGG